MIGHSFPTLEENPYIPTMQKNQILLTLAVAIVLPLGALGQPPAPATPSGTSEANPSQGGATTSQAPTEEDKLVDEASKKVAELKSASAELLQKVDMLGQHFSVAGRYLKAPEHRVYLRLNLVSGLPDTAGTTLQVCDGQTLWDYQQILENQTYRKTKIAQIFEKLDSPDCGPKLRDQIVASMGFTGPETLLNGLRKAVRFDQKEEGDVDGKPVWVLHGTWISREGLMGFNQQPMKLTDPMPAYVPSIVTLWIGKEDGWPYKVLLVGKVPSILLDDRPKGLDGRPLGPKRQAPKVQKTVIELSYSNVKLNPALKIEEFVFQAPPEARVEDATELILSRLDQNIQAEAARKKAEAAQGDAKDVDSILKQPIDVPKATAPTPTPTPKPKPKP